ncbi:hypothetical protein FKG94_08460 [Exilibacterium tricleocarpae]|uniref:Uncharacterized protein n=1 Tax=Exilibacterium tricleocarpae TaxID=2591008 RepID=A0A545TV88_9GAMM|nr:hypothetical protein [Exilibacterium tricleocarpae]TQV81133.1 hypothetical protein FKG94_08460 [Exilibacterium tricleocarpae]
MNNYWTIILGFLAGIHLAAAAHAEDLLIPIDLKTAEKIVEYNGNALKIALYFSARHKIVTINERLLLDEERREPFILSLFDGEKLMVRPQAIREHNFRRTSWTGEILYPSVEDKIQQTKQMSPEHADLVRSLTILNLNLLSWNINNVSGEAALASKPAEEMASKKIVATEVRTAIRTANQFENSNYAEVERQAFKTVRGSFRSLRTNRKYNIESLQFTPRYHILYEIDPEKSYHGVNEIPIERVARKKQLLLDVDKGEELRRLVESERKNEEKILRFEQFLDGLVKDNSNIKVMGRL